MTDSTLLQLDVSEGIATLTLNRPQSRNSLSLAMLEALDAQLAEIAQNPAIRVVILAGAGPAFCAGHDLKEIQTEQFACRYSEALFAVCGKVMQAIVNLPQPVIAQVHGIATAAGVQLVASADLAIAADNSRFATPGVNIGLFCSTPMVALSRNISHKHAMQMLLTGDLIDAQTALRFGLVNELVPVEDLATRTRALARQIASKAPLALEIGKKAFYKQAELGLADAYAYTQDVMVKNLTTLDAQEGINAFIEKRHPEWRGE